MVSSAGLYCIILFTVSLVIAVWASCSSNITCPCGNSRRAFYYTHCLNATEEEYTCERWANCKTCRANVTHCLKCPSGRSGPTCSEGKGKGETCRDPGIPVNGSRQNEYGADDSTERIYSEGEYVYFSCNEADSVLRGSSVITCTPSGKWSNSLPQCEKTGKVNRRRETCPDPDIPEGARRVDVNGASESVKRDFQEGESVRFYCDDGDVLEGASVMTCTSFGNWSETLPRCRKTVKTCPDPGIPEGGSRENTDGGAETEPRTFREGEMLYFYCDDENAELVGEYILNCTSFGNWTAPRPSCQNPGGGEGQIQTCPDPGTPQGGKRRNADGTEDETERAFQEGESVYFYCDDADSVIVGSEVINCTSFGTWSHPLPECEKVKERKTCPDPGIPVDGSRQIMDGTEDAEGRTFEEGVVINFYCNHIDYELKGDSIITCTSFGTWSHSLPQCEKTTEVLTCPDPGTPPGGRRQIADVADDASERVFQDGESVHFFCDEKDSVLRGDSVIICTSLGTWSGALPRCEKTEAVTVKSETCPDPGKPEDGIRYNKDSIEVVVERPFLEGESLYFYCKNGFELKGDSHITCISTGWSGVLPKCEKTEKGSKPTLGKPCKHPGAVTNGMIENLEGTDSLEEKQQVFPSATRLKFHCKEGYKLEGESVLFCLCSGEWTSDPPTCVSEAVGDGSSPAVHCKNRGPISNGRMTEYREMDRQIASSEEYRPLYSVGTRLHYTCDEGYILKGAKTIVCQSSGSWSGKEPTCVKDPDDEDDEPVRSKQARRGSGKPNSLTFKFFFF